MMNLADEAIGGLNEYSVSGGDHDSSVLIVWDVPLDKSGRFGEVFAVDTGVGYEGV